MTRLLATIAILTVLAGCAATRGSRAQGNVQFDFGPLPATAPAAAGAQLPPLVIPNVTGPASLDNQRMLYRLNYANPMQARFYSQNHWASTPLDLITQRIKARIAQGGTKVLSATDASNGAYLLRIEVDDFAHTFASTTESAGVVRLRASLFEGSRFIDQKTFVQSMPAPSADASGGAHALAAATDAVSDGIMAWIGSLPPRPR